MARHGAPREQVGNATPDLPMIFSYQTNGIFVAEVGARFNQDCAKLEVAAPTPQSSPKLSWSITAEVGWA